jgi:glucose-6-phosphate isomerase
VWSSVGLPIAISYGFDVFEQLLQGAHAMDQHALTAQTTCHLPMIAALCTYWNTQYLGATTEAVLPYGFRLGHLIPYIQQLSMESLGKQRTTTGERISKPTGPIVWGQTGVHAQHTFNQLLHQGNHCVSVEFILPMENKGLVQSCLAQSYALTYGDPDNPHIHARIEGNQPHQIIQFDAITPAALGALMAFYEHKTYLLGCLLGVNAFDQFGVELAKRKMST